MRRLLATASLALALAACSDCKGVSAPTVSDVEAGAGVASGICSYITGVDDTQVVRVICATVVEVAQIVEFILLLRTVDGGPPAAEPVCATLPGTALCVTSAERAKAILFITGMRAARLTIDGGTP